MDSNPVAKEFQVSGVSRSGRVRKKSSKLLDFESPEEIEKKTKRGQGRPPARYPGRGRPPNALREREHEMELDQELAYDDTELNASETEELEHTPLAPTPLLQQPTGLLMNSDDELDTLVQDLVEGVEAEATHNESRVRQSLYMREKSNKRKMLKDGKVVTGKMQRKDKGRSRYTAYSLWAREVRKRDFQDLDFANAARRLSELWANVSNKEKNAWRRKAKMQATKARTRERNGPSPAMASNGTALVPPTTNDVNFVNRATTSRTKKLAAERYQSKLELSTVDAVTASGGSNRQRRSAQTLAKQALALNSPTMSTQLSAASTGRAGSSFHLQQQQQQQQPPPSIDAIDAAAHLKLLGESLTVIGERLKEHNGHVALSGSLSVLLDSLLCSMGPLLCMTTQIPGLENKTQLSLALATTLDNIAYVMPGL